MSKTWDTNYENDIDDDTAGSLIDDNIRTLKSEIRKRLETFFDNWANDPDAPTTLDVKDDAILAEHISGLTGTGAVDLSKIPGDLDDISDGSTYIRLLNKIYIGNGTRANSDGDQVITGVGFQPRIIIFFAAADDDSTQDLSWGFDDGTNHMCLYYGSDDTQNINAEYSITIAHSVSGNPYVIRGYVSALSSDGFTITWSTVGNGNTARFTYLCLP